MSVSYSDKLGVYKGVFNPKSGEIEIYQKPCKYCLKKSDFCLHIPLSLIDYELNKHGNSNWVIHELVEKEEIRESNRWIDSSPTKLLKQKRKELWFLNDHNVDSGCRIVKAIYEKITGHPCRTPYERHFDQQKAL